jgi:magnesium-transporting ATPase (P-type)
MIENMDIDVSKLKKHNIILGATFILTMMLPPYYFLFEFKPELFKSLDFIRVITLSLSISFPVLMLHFVMFSALRPINFFDSQDDTNTNFEIILWTSSILTIPVFYLPCCAAWITGHPLTIKQAIPWAMGGFLVSPLLGLLVIFRDAANRRNNNSKKTQQEK